MEKTTTVTVILGALLSLSEVLALVPGIKSNSIFELVQNVLKSVNPSSESDCKK